MLSTYLRTHYMLVVVRQGSDVAVKKDKVTVLIELAYRKATY